MSNLDKNNLSLDISIFCAGMELDPNTLKEKSLGGSETAGVSMAHALSAKGHHVNLFCNTKTEGRFDGVQYLHVEKYQPYAQGCPHDVSIVQRLPEVFRGRLNSKINILWQHDVALKSQRASFHGSLWNIDKVFTLSHWQTEQYKEIYQLEEDTELFFQTKNGIKLCPEADESKRLPKRLVFTNRPERGMDNLLFNIMPMIWEKDPEIELCLAGYDNTHPNMEQFYNMCYSKVAEFQQQGYKVAHLGHLSKNELYELYKTSTIYIYPTAFHETSCITAMESQMCGLPMITSHIGALPETLCHKGNKFIFEDYKSNPTYNRDFVKTVFELLDNKTQLDEMRNACRQKSTEYMWENIAKDWHNEFVRIFEEKTMNKARLAKHLYEREDIMTLKHLDRNDLTGDMGIENDYEYLNSSVKYRLKYEDLGQEYVEQLTDNDLQLRDYARVNVGLSMIKEHPKKVLDFASGIANESIIMANKYGCSVDSVNISEVENEFGEKMIEKFLKKGEVNQIVAEDTTILDEKYDTIFLGEILEHQPDPVKFLEQFDKVCQENTRFIITVPYGLWEDGRKAHVWNFERYDLHQIFKNKKDLQIQMVSGAVNNAKQQQLGWWVISYLHNDKKYLSPDMDRKLFVQNPRETLSVCMIVKNEENMLHRCLKSVAPIADEIIINDTGSTDSTLDIAKQYNAIILNGDNPLEVGFDVARNYSIFKAKSDWILWLDADEEIIDTPYLLKYLRPNIFKGYSIKQHHFTVDAGEAKIDTPIRIFRNNQSVCFYGFVHEHPERQDMINEGVGASTLLGDVHIAHDGYFSENRRRGRFQRNIGLMFKEYKKHPERLLTKFLMMRDYIHINRYEKEQNGNQMTPYGKECIEKAIQIYRDNFLYTVTNYNDEALLFYSECLKELNIGLEYRFNLNVGFENVQPDRMDTVCRFADVEELLAFIKQKADDKSEPFTGLFV